MILYKFILKANLVVSVMFEKRTPCGSLSFIINFVVQYNAEIKDDNRRLEDHNKGWIS